MAECLNAHTSWCTVNAPSAEQEPAMPIQRLNHAVLYVRDVERSSAFYRDVLGFRTKMEIPGAAVFLQAEGSTNDHDLGLFQIGAGAGPSEAGRRTGGLYHLAWEVDTLAELSRIRDALLQAEAPARPGLREIHLGVCPLEASGPGDL